MKLFILSVLSFAAVATAKPTLTPTFMSGKFLKEQCELGVSLYLKGYSQQEIKAKLENNMISAYSPMIRNICDRKRRSLDARSTCSSIFTYVLTAVHTGVDTLGSFLASQSLIFEVGGGGNVEIGGISITIDLSDDILSRHQSSYSPQELQLINSTCKVFDTFEGVNFNDPESVQAFKNLANGVHDNSS